MSTRDRDLEKLLTSEEREELLKLIEEERKNLNKLWPHNLLPYEYSERKTKNYQLFQSNRSDAFNH